MLGYAILHKNFRSMVQVRGQFSYVVDLFVDKPFDMYLFFVTTGGTFICQNLVCLLILEFIFVCKQRNVYSDDAEKAVIISSHENELDWNNEWFVLHCVLLLY